MAEQQFQPDGSEQMDEPRSFSDGAGLSEEGGRRFTREAVTPPARSGPSHATAENTDDRPTVISRQQPRSFSSSELLNGAIQGQRLAHFELIEKIGVGGMAAVVRARDVQLERQVALKILPPEMAVDTESVRRFRQEARAAAKLDHENIARVFYCGEDRGIHFIAFEFVEGENLRTILERRGKLPVVEALQYMLHIVTGMAHAAERGVVHRDIKPSNIIITPTGRAKLVDMGLARSLEQNSEDRGLTQSGVTLGTFDYISPEQALEPRDADARSDIYSLGCTFYHALTGQPPAPEGTAAKKLRHHQQEAPVDPRQLNPEIPDEVAAILSRMMAKEPKDRYQRPEHIIPHLLAASNKLGGPAGIPKDVPVVGSPLPGPPRLRPVLLATVAFVSLSLLVILLSQVPGGGNRESVQVLDGIVPLRDRRDKDELREPLPVLPPPPSKSPTAGAETPVYDTQSPSVRGIAEFLQKHRNAPEVKIILKGDLHLPDELEYDHMESGGLSWEGKKVVIESARDLHPPATIWIEEDDSILRSSTAAALSLKCESASVERVRFVVVPKKDAGRGPEAAPPSLSGMEEDNGVKGLAAVWVRGSGEFAFKQCEFVQIYGKQTAAVVVGPHPGKSDQGRVELTECYFVSAGRWKRLPSSERGLELAEVGGGLSDAVQVAGTGQIRLTNCAFGPHRNLVHFVGSDLATARTELVNCTAFLGDDAAVFHLEHWRKHCTLAASHCLFSHPSKQKGMMDDDRSSQSHPPASLPGVEGLVVRGMRETADLAPSQAKVDFIRVTGPPPERLDFKGNDNRYQNLNGFRVKPGSKEDSFSEELGETPWTAKAPLELLTSLEPARLREAFQLNTNRRNLRRRDMERDSSRMVGVERCTWGALYPDKLPAPPDRP